MQAIYLLKEYDDELAYGEECIRAYRTREAAVAQLKEDFCQAYHLGAFERPSFMDEQDSFSDDYIAITTFKGSTDYFIVQEITILEK